MARKSGPGKRDKSEMDRSVSINKMTNDPPLLGYGAAGE
jgi:hypothetical protein